MTSEMVDFVVTGGGTVYVLTPQTERAQEWLDENVNAPDWAFMGRGVAVEHRYIADIVEGARADGLSVE